MKKVKFILWLLVLICLGVLIYQNQEYFFSVQALEVDLKVKTWQWTLPAIQNIAYMGICLAAGLLIAATWGISSKIRSNRIIRTLNETVDSHAAQITSLRTELEVYINDPYIKKQLQEEAGTPALETPKTEDQAEEPLTDADAQTVDQTEETDEAKHTD
ncbi:MAG: hypothetical protein D3926_21320 [Desulfobacteraceae bacterium]|nr:MAG: hypothetical protein D3926_21320 [Desulfobacteraceae bacterium]